MSSQRVLAGVAHSIAHHAASGLSYVHPHLFHACASVAVHEATIDLLSDNPYPLGLPTVEPLRLSLGCVARKFKSILLAHGLSISDVSDAALRVQFPLVGGDGYACQVEARITSSRRKVYYTVV